MNKLIIIGNLTKDPETRTTSNGKTVCSFWVAVNQRRTDADGNSVTDFFKISTWNSLADVCARFLTKGRKVAVVGSVSCRAYQTNAGEVRSEMDVLAENVEFLSQNQQAQPSQDQQGQDFTQVDASDDLPF